MYFCLHRSSLRRQASVSGLVDYSPVFDLFLLTVEAFEIGGEYVGLGKSINDVLVFLVSESAGCNEILLLEIFNTLSSALTTLTG